MVTKNSCTNSDCNDEVDQYCSSLILITYQVALIESRLNKICLPVQLYIQGLRDSINCVIVE